jgi:hypothetical protein
MTRRGGPAYKHTSQPFAVVTVFSDGSGVDVRPFANTVLARAWVEKETGERLWTRMPHERRVVRLPELLAWVRANEVSG